MNAALTQYAHNVAVIVTVTCETIDLVYDYVIHTIGVFSDVFKHCLELWAVSGFSRCTAVDKFFPDHCAQGCCLLFVCFMLRWNRKTFVVSATTFGLSAS